MVGDSTQTGAITLHCGVDVGASATKLVLLRGANQVIARVVRPSGVDYRATARACLDEALGMAPLGSRLVTTVSTGYGRSNVDFAERSVTEIHCHGVACFHLVGGPATLIDIGGQDNKVIRIDGKGKRIDFKMNRKCAAGTGAFLEEIALRLDLDVAQLDALAASTLEAAKLSSFCTVFAKTEILAHLSRRRGGAEHRTWRLRLGGDAGHRNGTTRGPNRAYWWRGGA